MHLGTSRKWHRLIGERSHSLLPSGVHNDPIRYCTSPKRRGFEKDTPRKSLTPRRSMPCMRHVFKRKRHALQRDIHEVQTNINRRDQALESEAHGDKACMRKQEKYVGKRHAWGRQTRESNIHGIQTCIMRNMKIGEYALNITNRAERYGLGHMLKFQIDSAPVLSSTQ